MFRRGFIRAHRTHPISVIMTSCIMCRLNKQEVEDDLHVQSNEEKK